MAATLVRQCDEVLHEIFSHVHPTDLASLSRSCKTFAAYITTNKLLWKSVYLNHFDKPRVQPDWEQSLKEYTIASKVLDSRDPELKSCQVILDRILKLCTEIAGNADANYKESRNIAFLKDRLSKQRNRYAFVMASNLYREPMGISPLAVDISSNAAHLHCLFGTAVDFLSCGHAFQSASDLPLDQVTGQIRAHPYARAEVYDLRRYTSANKWGPWIEDTMQVDWERVECIMLDLAFNVQYFTSRTNGLMQGLWKAPFGGVVPDSYVDAFSKVDIDPFKEPSGSSSTADASSQNLSVLTSQPSPPPEALDPYGITGTWQRVVCFLDYRDFYDTNFGTVSPLNVRRPPINRHEAIRLILMRLKVTGTSEPGPNDGNRMPVAHFKGTSRSMHSAWDPNTSSRIEGNVETKTVVRAHAKLTCAQ
jgi:hypothetical protein